MIWALVGLCAAAAVPAGSRWLRVAQREHYLAASATRFALRWWGHTWVNRVLGALSLMGLLGSIRTPWLALMAVAAQVGPVGLSVRGRTSPLAWTARMRRVAALAASLEALLLVWGGVAGLAVLPALGLVGMPILIDLTLWLLAPVERRLGSKWVDRAAARLRSSGAEIVAITGSYGKTTTKGYVAHLLGGSRRVVASPASFNNRMGLARAVNEQLTPGTQVFIAEMGTYGPGEIADLCEWMPPKVGAVLAIGPVHLERFRTEERVLAAKSEILDRAEIAVIGIDHPLLAGLAIERAAIMPVITFGSGDTPARVVVRDGELLIDGRRICGVPRRLMESNLAAAVAICLALGAAVEEIEPRLDTVPGASHRLEVVSTDRGVIVIDDTYNSNPAGVASALETLSGVSGDGLRVVVTPGMVELGRRQHEANVRFAERAAKEADHVVIVGGTNRPALVEGSSKGTAAVTVVDSRDEAVAWVKENLTAGDAVLYENDLPDHYP